MCTGFARIFLLGVSMNSGFVGGIILPMLTVGLLAGAIMSQMYPYIPVALCESAFMVSIACGVVPAPVTFSVLAAFIFYLGAYQSIPIFVAVFTSYTITCGTGFFRELHSLSQRNQQPGQGDPQKEDFDENVEGKGGSFFAENPSTAKAASDSKNDMK
jgi:H+/Cl- antiporter ClcA